MYTITRGDTVSLDLPLTLGGLPYCMLSGSNYLLTVKNSLSDPDSAAVVQKALGAGLRLDLPSNLWVDFVPIDFYNQTNTSFFFDVQAQESGGAIRTVFFDTLGVTTDVTLLTGSSIPIHTTNPPYPGGTILTVTGSNGIFSGNLVGADGLTVSFDGTNITIAGTGGAGGPGGTGTQLSVTGSQPLPTANLTGVGGAQVFLSGGYLVISGGAGAGTVTQVQLDSLSGFTTGMSGYLAAQIAAISGGGGGFNSGLGGGIYFDFKQGLPITSGITQQFVQYSQTFGLTPFPVYSITNLSGESILGSQISGLSTSGFYLSLSATVPSANYQLNYVATTGTGYTLVGGGVDYGQFNALSGWAASQLQATGALLSAIHVTGSSTINSANFTGIGGMAVFTSGAFVFFSGGNSNNAGGGGIYFDLRQSVPITSGVNSQFVPYSQPFGAVAFPVYSITNASGEPIFGSYITGMSPTGFYLVASTTVTSPNYSINYIATTGSGFNLIGGGAGGGGGGVPSVNGITSAVTIAGAGTVAVSTNGSTITVSGDPSISGALTATGVAIENQIVSLSGWAASAAALATTGSTLDSKINALSGYDDATYATIATVNLVSGNLAQTGVAIEAQIASLSGFATGISGFLQTEINALPTSAQLTQTGIALGAKIDALSGYDNATFATIVTTNAISGNLIQTGVQLGLQIAQTGSSLYSDLIGTSGWVNATFSTLVNLALTGSNLYALLTNESGVLTGLISQTSGVLQSGIASTGSILYGDIASLSGQASATYATISNLALTGSNLYVTMTGMSGQSVLNYATIVNLGSTGSTLYSDILGLSGNLIASGGLLSAVKVTGSSIIPIANFTGLGGTLVFTSGGFVFISGAGAGGGTNVTSLNGLINAVTVVGTGGLTVTTQGQNVLISGDSSISGALTATGAAIEVQISSLSGYVGNASGALQTLVNATGLQLYQDITGLSGQVASTYATITNVTLTGVAIEAQIASLSGFVTGTSGFLQTEINALPTSAQLTQTGVVLEAQIAGLSGVLNTTSGALQSAINTVSSNLTTTGQTLLSIIAGISGQDDQFFVHKTGIESITGQKTFVSNVWFNNSLEFPVHFVGANANYTLTSGDLFVAFTGANANATGILPSPTVYSGSFFSLINAGTTPLQISGIIGPDTNPILSQYDTIQAYAWSGQWNYIRETGNPNLTNALISLSGWAASASNLASTGSALYNDVVGLSGATNALVALTGQAAWTSANGAANTISGNITQTGVTLLSVIANTGQSAYNLYTGLSGALAQTGSTLQGQINTLTTNLTQTGVAIETQISSLSGFTTGISGYLLARIAGASAGVSALNGISGSITLAGTGDITVIANGQTILISGDQSISGALTATGVAIEAQISSLSGYVGNASGALQIEINTLTTNLTQTGVTIEAQLASLSGYVSNSSGALQSLINGTGLQLYQDITGLSGQAVATYATLANVTLTGVAIEAQIVSLSGFVTGSSGALNTLIALTGQAAWTSANGAASTISGNVATTGQTLYNDLIGLSGVVNSIFRGDNLVYATGNQSITGNISVGGQFNFLSGLATPVSFFSGNYTLGSGVYVAIATGTSVNVTGILPNATSVSGLLFALINNTTGPLQISGIVGPDTNPIISQYDTLEVYATSGVWNYVRQTGNANLTNALISLSGWAASAANLASTGSTLFGDIAGLSGSTSALVAATGQTLLNDIVGLSGVLNSTGGILGVQISALSGFTANASGALQTLINLTGNALYADLTGASGQFNTNFATVTNLTQTGVIIEGQIASLSGWAASAANLALTGSTLYVDLTGFSGQANLNFATITNLTQTGVTIEAQIASLSGFVGNVSGALSTRDSIISGAISTGLGLTGQTLYGYITAMSGQDATSYAPALANYLYQTGFRPPVHFIGVSNYTPTSGDFFLIATGSPTNVTGILPSATAYSGNLFVLVNNCSGPLQISGVIGPDTNPVLSQYDCIEAYATSGTWNYLRQTGAAGLVNAIVALSGWAASAANLASTGQQSWTAAQNNAVNLSGNAAATGATLLSTIAQTGSNLYVVLTGMSGQANTNFATVINLASTGSALFIDLTGLSGAHNTLITASGAVLYNDIIGLSGNLIASGALLSAVKVTGSSIINVANLTGIGGTQVILSGGYIAISGGGGGSSAGVSSLNGLTSAVTIVGTGLITASVQGQNVIISGDTSISGALTATGVAIENQINALSGYFTGLIPSFGSFSFLSTVPFGIDTYFVPFQNYLFTTVPIVNVTIESVTGNSNYGVSISGRTVSGFYANFTEQIGESNLLLDVFVNSATSPNPNLFSYLTGVPTGSDTVYFAFSGVTFPSIPRVVATMETSFFGVNYPFVISGRSTTGFFALFGDQIVDSGLALDVTVKV